MKLHLGCGKRDFGEDWIHIDGATGEDFYHVKYYDVTKLPFEENSVDLIYASHLIAYWDLSEILDILAEWRRVLKTDGVLRIATPDFEAMIKLYIDQNYNLASFLGPLYGKIELNGNNVYHKMVYDFKNLSAILTMSKFKDVVRYDWKKTDHANFDDFSRAYLPHMNFETGTLISLNVECKK